MLIPGFLFLFALDGLWGAYLNRHDRAFLRDLVFGVGFIVLTVRAVSLDG